MKKYCAKLLIIILILSVAMPVTLQANTGITVTIDGERVIFADQTPVIVGGRTLVPLRGVFEALGFYIEWNNDTRTAYLFGFGIVISITIGSYVFTLNGVEHALDVPAQIINGRTMLPIRAVLENVGFGLDWNDATRTVVITDPASEGISEYGRRVAEEFLSQFVSAISFGYYWEGVFRCPFSWLPLDYSYTPLVYHILGTDTFYDNFGNEILDDVPFICRDTGVLRVASGFALHDIDNNGIPEITISFLSVWDDSWLDHGPNPPNFWIDTVMFRYYDGEYHEIHKADHYSGEQFFTDKNGRPVMQKANVEGDIFHWGWFHVMFDSAEMILEPIFRIEGQYFHNNITGERIHIDDFYDMHVTYHGFIPGMLDEPLTIMRPMAGLRHVIRSSISRTLGLID